MRSMRLRWASTLGALAVALVMIPNGRAECGMSTKMVKPTGWNPQMNSAHLVRASLANWDDDEGGPSIVGMWHVTLTSEGSDSDLPPGTPVDNALVVWHSDHTEIMNSYRPPQDGQFCMGVWRRVGNSNQYKLNHFAWFSNVYDPTNPNAWSIIGPAQGPTHFVEKVTLSADGKHYSGTFTLDAYDTSFNHTVHITGTLSATRITIDTTMPDLE